MTIQTIQSGIGRCGWLVFTSPLVAEPDDFSGSERSGRQPNRKAAMKSRYRAQESSFVSFERIIGDICHHFICIVTLSNQESGNIHYIAPYTKNCSLE